MALDPNYAASSKHTLGETLLQELIRTLEATLEIAKRSSGENILESAEAILPKAVIAHKTVIDSVIIATWQAVQTKATTPDEVHQIFAGLTAKNVPFKL